MASDRPLPRDIKSNGMDQASKFAFFANTKDLVNEIQTDHATQKTSTDESKTLTDELHDDHATYKTVVDDLKTLLNDVRTYLTGDRLWSGNPALAIDTNFDVQSANAVVVSIDGVLASVAAATCDTGTAATFPTTTWGIFLVSSDSAGTLTATWNTNTSSGFSTEALAKAGLPAAPSAEAPVGFVTVQAHATGTFLAGTDALTTGTGGDVANATNFSNLADPLTTVTAAVSSSSPATLTATKATAGPGTLTNSTALTLLRS